MTRCGIDIVEIDRIRKVRERHDFDHRFLTPGELEYARMHRKNESFFAGRWAAKEAVSKALGCGIGKHCSLLDIEVLSDSSGAPQLRLSGAAAETARKLGISTWSISISHEKNYAVAMVVAEVSLHKTGKGDVIE